MINEALTDLDLFNFYALDFLELNGNFFPKQFEIDRVEHSLKTIFKLHVNKIRSQFTFDAEAFQKRDLLKGGLIYKEFHKEY